MYKFFCSILIIFNCAISSTLYSQNESPVADSLKSIISFHKKNESVDSVYINTIIRLCREYQIVEEFDSILVYALPVIPIVEKLNATAASKTAKQLYSMQLMSLYKSLGIARYQITDYPRSLAAFQNYLKFAEILNSINDQGSAFNYIGYNHREMGDIEKALVYNSKAISILQTGTNKVQLANAYTGRSTLLDDMDAPVDSILFYNKKSIALCLEAGDIDNAANTTLNIAETYNRIRDFDSCKVWAYKMKDYIEKDGSPVLQIRLLSILGRFEFLKGNHEKSLQYAEKAASLAGESGNPNLLFHTFKYLALAQAATNSPKLAMVTIDKSFDAYSDDMNSDKVRELNSIQLKNEFEKEKQLQLFEFEKKDAINKEEIKRQTLIRNFSIAGILAIFAIAFLLFRLNGKLKQSYLKLQQTQLQLIETEKQREAQNVRVSIARDIHDELGSGLTRITMLSDLAVRKVRIDPESAEQSLKKITTYSKGVSSSLHEIVWAVNPGYDTLEGLSNFMKQYADQFLEDTGIPFTLNFETVENNFNISPESRRNIFLVLKEALNNSVKYSQAKKITISFSVINHEYQLEIKDDGVGFSINDPTITAGNGLGNMKKRIELIGGTLLINSSPGKGSVVLARGILT
ncbi:MAG: sensor histidine kinase [Bacteroidetes bacterium]|nr:sensor histidine kinase [Bacteroidota bacterium]